MWKAFAEHFKECGRNGTLFVAALMAILLVTFFVSAWGKGVIITLWVAWSVLLMRSGIRFVYDWKNPARLGKMPPLSQHDRRIARSKLINVRNPQSG
jgi:hypothetical protein